ncbi:MAG: hypothetical protein PHV61_03545 [Limnochordia bacterium]|jgi:hypothetical protein|nr:hypothetical protein [Limnochordia bacterium]MDD2629225.1 hypothetical protein [Limnochordia bacterium]MDD4517383.1 hypothetical protein [Limnochordia bacterium]
MKYTGKQLVAQRNEETPSDGEAGYDYDIRTLNASWSHVRVPTHGLLRGFAPAG